MPGKRDVSNSVLFPFQTFPFFTSPCFCSISDTHTRLLHDHHHPARHRCIVGLRGEHKPSANEPEHHHTTPGSQQGPYHGDREIRKIDDLVHKILRRSWMWIGFRCELDFRCLATSYPLRTNTRGQAPAAAYVFPLLFVCPCVRHADAGLVRRRPRLRVCFFGVFLRYLHS